jgi:quinoprotein dehydrogenase-associated probable ABC transporter substrate-binding protein
LTFGWPILRASTGWALDDRTPPASQPATRVLRVVADPNNLPFSNQREQGFENHIAQLVARELNARLEYTWRAQRRGFFRETLKSGQVDLVIGVPVGFDMALPTSPYYRSSYVFVSRRDRELHLSSLDDPRLPDLRIGVQLIGNDGVNTPPAHALGRRNIITNLVGFTVYGNYAEQNPAARIVDAVAHGDVDTAIVWGPVGGYFAAREAVDMEVAPVSPASDGPALRFTFAIAMGVAKKNTALRDELNRVIDQRRDEIRRILDDFNIPQVAATSRPSPEVAHP